MSSIYWEKSWHICHASRIGGRYVRVCVYYNFVLSFKIQPCNNMHLSWRNCSKTIRQIFCDSNLKKEGWIFCQTARRKLQFLPSYHFLFYVSKGIVHVRSFDMFHSLIKQLSRVQWWKKSIFSKYKKRLISFGMLFFPYFLFSFRPIKAGVLHRSILLTQFIDDINDPAINDLSVLSYADVSAV